MANQAPDKAFLASPGMLRASPDIVPGKSKGLQP